MNFFKNLKTAASYWVGSDVIKRTPDIWMKYDNDVWQTFKDDYETADRVDDVMNWIYKFQLDFTCLYLVETVRKDCFFE